MLDKMLVWFRENEMQFTWFIIGFLTMACVDALVRGNYLVAIVDVTLIGINYYLRPRTV
jgi:hypothetical protein